MPGSPPSSENRRQKNAKHRSSVASRMTGSKNNALNNQNNVRNNGHKDQQAKWDNVSINLENIPLVFQNQNLPNPPKPKNNNNKPPSPIKAPSGAYKIPDYVMADICFRFLDNIPDHEKIDEVRVCFQIEQAHWFYEDFVCKSKNYPECKHIGFKDFARQIFNACDYLDAWKGEVDSIIDHFRMYKSNVPTYGAILLDETLTYVLLVQGWFASKNNWGFPKGKVNEHEDPVECAIREVFEETGYDITSKINPNIMFTNQMNDTMVCLYVVTGVEMSFPFKPHARKEIRKIQWVSVWDLPVDRFDHDGCARLELTPQNFYTVLPFVKDIQAFIKQEQSKRMKNQPKVLIGQKSSSAFEPVVPKPQRPWPTLPEPSFQQSLMQSLFPSNMPNLGGPTILTASMDIRQQGFLPSGLPTEVISTAVQASSKETLFKPLKLENSNQPASFTGEAFLEMITQNVTKSPKIASPSPGVIGGESVNRRKEIKHPKPLHSNLKICVYEASPENPNQQKQQKLKETVAELDLSMPSTSTAVQPSFVPYPVQDNEIANMLMSTVASSSHHLPEPQQVGSFTTPQRGKNQRPELTPTSNVFQQGPSSAGQKQESLSPSNLEPLLQTSGSMRKRGSRGKKRNRKKSQSQADNQEPEKVEKQEKPEKEEEKAFDKTPKNKNATPKLEPPKAPFSNDNPHWQTRGISIDLNALFGAAAKGSTSTAQHLQTSSTHRMPSRDAQAQLQAQNSTSPVLRLLQNLSISPNITNVLEEPSQGVSTPPHIGRVEMSGSPYDNGHQPSNGANAVEERNSHPPNDQTHQESFTRPVIQLCNTWKSFKLDASKLMFA